MKIDKLFSDLKWFVSNLNDDDNIKELHGQLNQILAELQALQTRTPEFEKISAAELSSIRGKSVALISEVCELKDTKRQSSLFFCLKYLSKLCVVLNEIVLRKNPQEKCHFSGKLLSQIKLEDLVFTSEIFFSKKAFQKAITEAQKQLYEQEKRYVPIKNLYHPLGYCPTWGGFLLAAGLFQTSNSIACWDNYFRAILFFLFLFL